MDINVGKILKTATETVKGVVELATPAEVLAGVDEERAVTPAGFKAGLEAAASAVSAAISAGMAAGVISTCSVTQFDAAGEPSAITIGTATITITRDADRRLSVIINSSESGYIYRAQYDSDGRFTGLTKEAT